MMASSRPSDSIRFSPRLRITVALLSIATSYGLVRVLRIDQMLRDTMVYEGQWFIDSFYVCIVLFVVLTVTDLRLLLSSWYTKAFWGATCGYLSGLIAGIVAGNVRGGVLMRLRFLFRDPVRECIAYFMTMTWFVGLVAFLCLHLVLISVIAISTRIPRCVH